ncbi:MAG: virulence-associated E family protein [Firmicutes bacterium]|nr:virulence-associated E family protein [Bacillota bacterium]
MRIAIGNSRMDKKWKNKDISWDDFKQKCSQTIRTTETVAEYRKMSKPAQDNAKDVGGFVGGALKQGKRKNGFVMGRSMLTIDLDHAVKDIWDAVTMLFDFKCLMYSTHKHTPEAPRVRLIIPLSREVSAEEYAPVSRMVAKDIGMEMVDDTCHEAARLMYWPSTSSDGVFLFESQDGPMLNPDDILARYKDWHDTSEWPMSSRQSEIVKRTIAKQADPLDKEGMVGAFCRAYSIEAAIDTFIPDIYKPSAMAGRYDYIPADSSAGVVIYDDKFAYSHHATDPACGNLMNAFDVVRIHKFGALDDKAKPDTPPSKMPSFKAMVDFAIKDDKVKLQLAKEREAQANAEFDDTNDVNWQTKLELDKNGGISESLTNFVIILRHDPRLQEISYNEHSCGISIRDNELLPWGQLKPGWSDADLAALTAYLDRVYHIFSPSKLKNALLTITAERSFHPIKEYLENLPAWDGTKRVETLLVDYLGAEDTSYVRAVTRKTLVAAVARVYEPGIKFDTVLVLSGPQGVGKSMFFAKIGGIWFSDSLTISDMRDKTGAEKLQGFWIMEIGEMNGIKKVEVETVKSFASRQDDKFRVAYGTVVESHPRQCVICGTSNSQHFLRDVTGNRRFWPVQVTGESDKHPWDMDKPLLEQIWAEALTLYNAGEELILKGNDAEMAAEKQQEALENDDREGLVREYLDKLLPSDWSKLSLVEKRMFLSGDEFATQNRAGVAARDKVCNLEIWAECFGREPANIRKQDSYELNAIMAKIDGWERYDGNKSGKLSFKDYGSQIAYVRTAMVCDDEAQV